MCIDGWSNPTQPGVHEPSFGRIECGDAHVIKTSMILLQLPFQLIAMIAVVVRTPAFTCLCVSCNRDC